MKCENCKVEINNLSSNCPLCGKHLQENPKAEDAVYPDIKQLAAGKYSRNIKILLFFTIVLTISAFIVNMLTPYNNLWSFIAISAMWLLWLVFGVPIIKRKITPLMIVLDNIALGVFLNIIDMTLNQQGWAMSYVVPFILCGSALIITIIVKFTKLTWREFYLFQIAIVSICFIPIIIRIFFNFVLWPSLISAVYGLVTILGMLLFAYRKFKHETKKRFHF